MAKIKALSAILVLVLLIWAGVIVVDRELKPLGQVESVQTEAINTLHPTIVPGRVMAKVTRVVDGDTVKLESGETVRYIGIDTPETVDPRQPVQCFGLEASNKNKELVEGKTVELEKDVSETDNFGRLLRYVWVEGRLVNELLVEEGYAHASAYPPDIKYQERFESLELKARSENKGLWGTADCAN